MLHDLVAAFSSQQWGCSSLGRAVGSQSAGTGIETLLLHHFFFFCSFFFWFCVVFGTSFMRHESPPPQKENKQTNKQTLSCRFERPAARTPVNMKRQWCIGNIEASQALAPGSTPGWCTFVHCRSCGPMDKALPSRQRLRVRVPPGARFATRPIFA